MTDKELLLKDISSRILYGIKGSVYGEEVYETNSVCSNGFVSLPNSPLGMCEIQNFKPYLFPMSSITEEQKKEFDSLTNPNSITESLQECLDWLNSHHFDYNNLIDKGLAINATDLNIY